jgi:hypothetical protein
MSTLTLNETLPKIQLADGREREDQKEAIFDFD